MTEDTLRARAIGRIVLAEVQVGAGFRLDWYVRVERAADHETAVKIALLAAMDRPYPEPGAAAQQRRLLVDGGIDDIEEDDAAAGRSAHEFIRDKVILFPTPRILHDEIPAAGRGVGAVISDQQHVVAAPLNCRATLPERPRLV